MTTGTIIRLKRSDRSRDIPFSITPDATECRQIAEDLGISALRKLRFEGVLKPDAAQDWVLEGHLGATVVQPCISTLAPVTTRIEDDVARQYRFAATWPDAEEAEMPEDDGVEPLPDEIDIAVVAVEALALALPMYPRADDAPVDAQQFGPPGTKPMTDEDAKPLAGLAALRAQMTDAPEPDDEGKK